jgi:putative ABC transport system substrate-binding protein
VAKRLALLHELVPKAIRVAVLVPPDVRVFPDVQDAAGAIGLQLRILNATTINEIDAAFATFARDRPDALFVAPSSFFTSRPRATCHIGGARPDTGSLR